MSKITYIGGDLIEEIGGSYKIYAKEGYEISSLKQIVFNAKDGIKYGINEDAPSFNTVVDFYVDIFRTKTQIPDHFGLEDTDYKGTFGFDRYNETTSGKGKQSLSSFEEMSFNGNKYYVPWLCLWTPKKHLSDIADIDKDYEPITKAALVFKICEGVVKKGNVKFSIASNHPSLKIDGVEKVEKQGAINSTINVTVSCEGVLEKDVDIEIKNEIGILVGKLKVVKNNIIYIANTKFITVMEEEKATNSVSRQQKREAEKTKFQSLIKDVIVYLNKNSLNQALIYVKGTVEDIFVIDKGEIIRNKGEGAYSSSVTRPYFEGKSEDKNIDDSKETKEEKELDKAIKELYNALNSNYKKNRKNAYFCDDTVKQTSAELFLKYEEKYQIYLNSLTSKKIGSHLRDNNTIYVFVDKNQETLRVGSFNYYGYTLGADNCAFVFNKHVTSRKFGTFAHEIAHSLGLEHTFELDENEYQPNKSINRDIEQKEATLKEKRQSNQPQKTPASISRIQTIFTNIMENNLHFPVVQKPEQISGNFNGSKVLYYSHIDSMFNGLKSLADTESKAQSSTSPQLINNNIDPIVSLQNEITALKTKRLENKNKYIDVGISLTQENFMDYDYDSNNNPNSNFEPKSFWYWQWKKLNGSLYLTQTPIK